MQIVYYAASSLDHYIAREDGTVDWLDPFNDTAEETGITEFFESVDGIVMGSATYDFALNHPPWLAPDTPSWVFTTRSLPLADPSITLTSQEPSDFVKERKAAGHKKLWLMGGGKLATSFREQGLITHYEITIVPVILGSGIPLLNDAPGQENLHLLKCNPMPSGLVTLSYETGHTL
ncbi:MAG: dihydrofolate reductase [Planctomycetota bacterium]|jgi:dihydrofolate reductase